NKADIAVLVADAAQPLSAEDEALLAAFREKNIPYLIAYNKSDLLGQSVPRAERELEVSALTGAGIDALKEKIAALAPQGGAKTPIAGDLVSPGDLVVLVTPIDASAPKGRLILPQQQTIRDLLDADAVAVVTKETGLRDTLSALGRAPALVITDSQVFAQAAADTPADVPLTSFSILFARYKGLLDTAVDGAAAIGTLRDGDTVLISEGCTHHRQCDDIGRVKLPGWLTAHTGKQLNFAFTSGGEFPDDLLPYSLILHCGGCMLTDREVEYRRKCALDQGVPMTNYGVAIAYMKGILRRSLSVFPDLAARLAPPER
ncbi:MAG: [FeFe] hydrogenase H-cluster maturation GTPase HydF, partial [Clostridium sp. SCN 57-10]